MSLTFGTMSGTRNYLRIHDPGHSWLKVPIQDVRNSGVFDKITPYSYTKNGFMYLEEDCDMWTFYEAMLKLNVGVTVDNTNVDDFDEFLNNQ